MITTVVIVIAAGIWPGVVPLDEELPKKNQSLDRFARKTWIMFAPAELKRFHAVFRAQLLAESAGAMTAESPTGARCAMQIQPRTALHFGVDPAHLWERRTCLRTGALVMFEYFNMVMDGRRRHPGGVPASHLEGLGIAAMCYNAGPGNVIYHSSGGRLAANGILHERALPLTVANVLYVLPEIRGIDWRQTDHYIRRIACYVEKLGGLE